MLSFHSVNPFCGCNQVFKFDVVAELFRAELFSLTPIEKSQKYLSLEEWINLCGIFICHYTILKQVTTGNRNHRLIPYTYTE